MLLALLVSGSILLSGCAGFGDDSLLHPPKTTGKEAEIEKLIGETAGGGYMLKYPRSGQYRSAVVTEDFNNDKKDEAIAFYRTGTGEPSTHMLVMYDNGKNWKIAGDYETKFTDIDRVVFADIDLDGLSEIFVGFTGFTGAINELRIFDFSEDMSSVSELDFSASYSGFTADDYDRDGASELLTFSLKTADTDAEARLYDYADGALYSLSSCEMDPEIGRYDNICSGRLSDETKGVVIDGVKDSVYSSQVIFYDYAEAELRNYPYTTSKKRNPTVRSMKIFSGDIDNDDIIEIPKAGEAPALSTEEETVIPVINWSTLNSETAKLTDDKSCLMNPDFSYYLTLPESFKDTTVATLSKDSRTLKVYALSGDEKGGLIFTIKVSDVGSAKKMSGYKTLESYNQYRYTYKIDENMPIYISDTMLKESFSIYETSSGTDI